MANGQIQNLQLNTDMVTSDLYPSRKEVCVAPPISHPGQQKGELNVKAI